VTTSKKAVVATALALFAAGCSSSGHEAASTTTAPARSANQSVTTRLPPVVVGLTASLEAWTLPTAVSRPVVLADGSSFVVLGGLSTGDTSTSRIVRVDPVSGGAQLVGQLALAVHDSAGAVIANRFFVFGGGSFSTVSLVQAWTDGSASEVARLPDARSDLRPPRSTAPPTSSGVSTDPR
jgi:hypothetical protein